MRKDGNVGAREMRDYSHNDDNNNRTAQCLKTDSSDLHWLSYGWTVVIGNNEENAVGGSSIQEIIWRVRTSY